MKKNPAYGARGFSYARAAGWAAYFAPGRSDWMALAMSKNFW
jgi:hypothetical protein